MIKIKGKIKGFYLSLDALIAVMILLLFVSNVLAPSFSSSNSDEDDNIEAYTLTLASMMEKTMPVSNLSNNTTMLNFINSLQDNYCMSYEWFDFPPPTNNARLIFNITESSCILQDNYYQVFRSIINSEDVKIRNLSYGFRLRVWKR
jgi:hypothetical protein